MKPSKELSMGLLQILLARPPKLEEILDYAVKGMELGAEYLTRLPGFRTHLLSLLESKSYEDVDRALHGVFSTELRTLERFLPENYVDFLAKFLELYYIDYIALSISGTLKAAPGSTWVSTAGLTSATISSTVIAEYSKCAPKDVKCFLMKFFERIKASHDKLGERESRALDAIKALVTVRYFNYFRNSELLGLKLSGFEEVLAELGINPVVEISLKRALEKLEKLGGAELTRYTVYEASATYPLMRELLAYSGGLANILTLYLVSRYYELKVLRYTLVPRSLRRW